MANSIRPFHSLSMERKVVNIETYKEHFDKSQEEVARLKALNRDLLSSNERLTKKLEKRKNELESERESVATCRQLLDELKLKQEQIPGKGFASYLTEDYVERLVLEKSGLESQIIELRNENQTLNHEIISCKARLSKSTSQSDVGMEETEQLRSNLRNQSIELKEMHARFQKLLGDYNSQQRIIENLSHQKNQFQNQFQREANLVAKYQQDFGQEKYYSARQEDEFQRERSQMRKEVENKEGIIESMRHEVLTLKELNNTVKADEQKCKQEMLEVKEQQIELKSKIQELTEANTKIETNKQNCNVEMAELEKQLITLKSQLKDLNANKVAEVELVKENKELKSELEKLQKPKYPDPPGATPATKNTDMTPALLPISIPTDIATIKIIFRAGKTVDVAKLKALPYPKDCEGNQVIITVNKRFELGVLKTIFDVETKGMFAQTTVKYVGVQLFSPIGNSNGEYRGKRHFECEANFGYFVPYEDVFVVVI